MTRPIQGVPNPALSFEQMWYTLKDELASQVMNRRTAQAVYDLRELMAELESQRIAPLVTFVKERNMDRKFNKFTRAAR